MIHYDRWPVCNANFLTISFYVYVAVILKNENYATK